MRIRLDCLTREKSKASNSTIREKSRLVALGLLIGMAISCENSQPSPDRNPPEYRPVPYQSTTREKSKASNSTIREKSKTSDGATREKSVPSCEGLEGSLREKCVRGLAVLKSICPGGEVGGDGCERGPDLEGLKRGPTPYGFRNLEKARNEQDEPTEHSLLLFEGCSESHTVVLVEPGDHERPWLVADIVEATTTDLRLYRMKVVCPESGECEKSIIKPDEH